MKVDLWKKKSDLDELSSREKRDCKSNLPRPKQIIEITEQTGITLRTVSTYYIHL